MSRTEAHISIYDTTAEVTIGGIGYPVTSQEEDSIRPAVMTFLHRGGHVPLEGLRLILDDGGAEMTGVLMPNGELLPDDHQGSQRDESIGVVPQPEAQPTDAPEPAPAVAPNLQSDPDQPTADAPSATGRDEPAPTAGYPMSHTPTAGYPMSHTPTAGYPISHTPTAYGPPQVAPAYVPPASTMIQPAAVSSFLVHERTQQPAEAGMRGRLNRVGLNLAPSDREVALRDAKHAIAQHWSGVRTVAVVNGKGGAGKTPSTIGLAAAFAIHGGGGVIAVDTNPARGTLGWRTEQGPHQATVTDLIPYIGQLLRADASVSHLAGFVHHQTEDHFDVLRSKPERLGTPFTAVEFDAVVKVLAKFARILVFDSGNDETTPVWQHMINVTHQLVVATTVEQERAEAGRLLLEELRLRDAHGAALVANAIVIVSQADERKGTRPAEAIAVRFRGLVRGAAVIPYDPAMVEGHMRWNALAQPTQQAWIQAAALVAGGF